MNSDQPVHQWRRLWKLHAVPEGADFQAARDNAGPPPGDLAPYTSIERFDCLCLIGPPGSGKTTESQRAASGSVFVPLRYITSAEELRRAVSPLLKPPRATARRQLLFLDGFDEIPAKPEEARAWLIQIAQELRDQANVVGSRFQLRLTCRSADWPAGFERDLAMVFGATEVAVYQLQPLSEEDVKQAFPEGWADRWPVFKNEVTDKGLWPLAKLPVTGPLLLRAFIEGDGHLPTSIVDLYYKGLLAMVEERRRVTSALPAGELPAHDQLQLLGRIAAVSILTNRLTIWAGLNADKIPSGALPISELAGDEDILGGASITADEVTLRRLLKTAAFHSAAPQLSSWVHLSFAEYMAALYLDQSGKPTDVLLDLIATEEPEGLRIAPQLREVAGWLAGMRADFRVRLIRSEPNLLLHSDIAGADDDFKKALTRELLSQYAAGELLDYSVDYRMDFSRLTFSGIGELLRPYLRDPSKNDISRRAAIRIAEACQARELGNDLVALALDESDSADIRSLATQASFKLQADNVSRLKGTLQLPATSDPDDEIKGAALLGLWPQYISEPELFNALTLPRRSNLFGFYKLFLHQLSITSLTTDGAIAGLAWLGGLESDRLLMTDSTRLIQEVLASAWMRISEPAIVDAFAQLVRTSARDLNPVLRSTDIKSFEAVYALAPPDVRRNIMVAAATVEPPVRLRAVPLPWALTAPDDLTWLLDELVSSPTRIDPDTLIEAIIGIVHSNNEKLDFAWSYAQRSPMLKRALEYAFSVELGSSLARWMKEDYEAKYSPKPAVPDGSERDAALVKQYQEELERCKNDIQGWWRLNVILISMDGDGDLTSDLTDTKGWSQAKPEERAAMLLYAQQYLISSAPDPSWDWIGADKIWRPIAAGYRALRLLQTNKRADLESLPAEAWTNWVATTLWFPSNEDQDDRDARLELVRMGFEVAPQAFMSALRTLLMHSDANFYTADRVRPVYNEEIAIAIWSSLQAGQIERFASQRLSELLIEQRFQPIVDAAIRHLTQISDVDVESLSRDSPLVFLPAMYFLEYTDEAWPLLANRYDSCRKHFRAIWLWICDRSFFEAPYLSALKPAQLGELFVWLTREFPRPTEPMSGFIGPEHQMSQICGFIIATLVKHSTDEDVEALEFMARALPADISLKWHVKRAKEGRRGSAWRWPTTDQVLLRLGVSRRRDTRASILAKAQVEQEAAAVTPPESRAFPTISVTFEVLTDAPVAQKPLTFLVLASEWSSGHGGLSSFNREFCKALAQEGHEVICLLPEHSHDEGLSALDVKVKLMAAPPRPGFRGVALLSALSKLPLSDVVPDFVVGHDHITGPAALRISEFYVNAKSIHIIHTTPPQTEPEKSARDSLKGAIRGDEKKESQVELCEAASYVLAVGPSLYRYACGLVNDPDKKVLEFMPGLREESLRISGSSVGRNQKTVLWLGRSEDPELKGLDIALALIAQLNRNHTGGLPFPRLAVRGLKLTDAESRAVEMCLTREKEIKRSGSIDKRPYSENPVIIDRDIVHANCLIMPSQSEPFGLVALEAIALGTPVLISLQSGIGESIQRLARKGGPLETLATDFILEVTSDDVETAALWEGSTLAYLNDVPSALAKADALRHALAPHMNWRRSAKELVTWLRSR